jgi:serine/threonine protein kinase, bacterial
MIGQLLAGHYRILQVLGAGGFGQTYITEDLHLPGNPKCVLKHLKPASSDPALLSMARQLFEKEAIVLQQLGTHDRIPRLFAYFEEGQEFYLVQEYALGHTLTQELKDGAKWSDSAVIELLAEVLDILIFIHSKGVIHRDIKPDNIIRRDSDEHLVLIDFGAIKQVRNQQALNGQQTMTVAIGTPGYMPIEQASGTPRASSDIYALGTIAIQALTGVNPYNLEEDERTGEHKWEHLTTANPQLIAVVQRMTRYHFKDRYQTAADALQAILAVKAGISNEAATYIQQTQPIIQPQPIPQPPAPKVETQKTMVVSPRAAYTPPTPVAPPRYQPAPAPAYTPRTPDRSSPNLFLPFFAGLATISAGVGSFVWFSNTIVTQRNFASDLQSDLCRILIPTTSPTVRVRSAALPTAKIITRLPRGTKVVYVSEDGNFVNIQFAENGVGWVDRRQVVACPKPIATPTPTLTPSISPIPIIVPTPLNPLPIETPTPSPQMPSPSPLPTPLPRDAFPVPPSPVPFPIPTPTPSPTPSYKPTPSPDPNPSPITIPPQNRNQPNSFPKADPKDAQNPTTSTSNSGKEEIKGDKSLITPNKSNSGEDKVPLY